MNWTEIAAAAVTLFLVILATQMLLNGIREFERSL